MQGYKDIGLILTNAREERRLSIADVASVLHIRPRYIEALEDGNLEGLPGYPYVKGYLKRYAMYLALDKVEILRRFELVVEQAGGTSFFMPHSFSHEKHISRNFALASAGGCMLALFFWAFFIRIDQSPPPLIEPVPEKVTPVAVSPAPVHEPGNACMRAEAHLYPPCYWPVQAGQQSLMLALSLSQQSGFGAGY